MRCEVCSATVSELRRGRCWGCYSRWVDRRPVGLGASCSVCGERRREYLKSVELLGAWMPVCFNCGNRAASLAPLPQSLAEIRKALARDRRYQERRIGKRDTRVFRRERRSGERRSDARTADTDEFVAIEEHMIIEVAKVARDIVEQPAATGDNPELTRILELPLQP
jgi:hypothetical protein